MINKTTCGQFYVIAMQGENESWSETYLTYVERAMEFSTPQRTASVDGVVGSASKQDDAVGLHAWI